MGRASAGLRTGMAWFGIGRGGGLGTGTVADLTDEILPLEITYTLQNSGAPFERLVGTSVLLNVLSQRYDH